MKHHIILILISLFSIASCTIFPVSASESGIIGEPAPAFTLLDLNGKNVSLSDFKGKVVIIDFWATWCPPCVREIPHFIDLYKEYKDKGFAMVGISVDHQGINVVKAFNQRFNINYPILMADAHVAKAYGNIRNIPTTFVIDPSGNFHRLYVGYRSKSVFEKDIKKLLPDVNIAAAEKIETETIPNKYVNELNKIGMAGRPESDNAVPYYQKAIKLYIKKPEGLNVKSLRWPNNLPGQQKSLLTEWVQDNQKALEQLLLGSKKPYSWFKKTNRMLDVNQHLEKIIDLASVLHARAMLQAENGDISSAINDIITLYKFGAHIASGPNLAEEKIIGIAAKGLSIKAGFNILDRKMLNTTLMKNLEDRFKQLATDYNKTPDIRGDKINMREKIEADPSNAFYKEYLKSALEYSDMIATLTPWKIHTDKANLTTSINPLIEILFPAITRLMEIEYSSRAETKALITTLAILRYNMANNVYPASLSELISAGYIKELPIDPFSSNPLVYKRQKEGFILYSFGGDFDDDGGQHSNWGLGENGGDQVFWPVEERP